MKKNRTFKLILALLTGLSIITTPIAMAIFPEAETLMPSAAAGVSKKYVHILADWHVKHQQIAPQQIEDVVEAIACHDPADTLVLTENCKTFTTLVYPKLVNDGFFARISKKCKKKNIETHDLDYRFVFNKESGKITNYYDDPRISVAEFMATIQNHVNMYHDVLTPWQLVIFKKLQKVADENMLPTQTMAEFYDYCTEGNILDETTLIDFTDSLVDAAMLHKIYTTNKKHIFVIAGWWHTNNITQQLSAQNYHILNQQGITYNEFNKRINNYDRSPISKKIPTLDIKQYFAQTNLKMHYQAVIDYMNTPTFMPDLGITRFTHAVLPFGPFLA